MNRIVSDLSKLNIKEEDFDAISFFKSVDGYKFLIAKYKDQQTYEKTDLGYKYYMFHIDERENNVAIVEEAFLGDPVHVINNYVKANCEGIFAKKSATSKIILEKFVFGKESTKKFEDFKAFVKAQDEAKSL